MAQFYRRWRYLFRKGAEGELPCEVELDPLDLGAFDRMSRAEDPAPGDPPQTPTRLERQAQVLDGLITAVSGVEVQEFDAPARALSWPEDREEILKALHSDCLAYMGMVNQAMKRAKGLNVGNSSSPSKSISADSTATVPAAA